MFSDGYKSKYYNQQLLHKVTSGSSGIPINIYWDMRDYYSSTRYLWNKRLKYYNIHPFDKYISFDLHGFNTSKKDNKVRFINEPKNLLNINYSSIQDEKLYKYLVDIIDDFKPKWLYVRPFVLQKLIALYENHHIPQSLKYIESYGEVLPPELRKKAINIFKVPIANMYGAEEVNTIAFECPYHKMHIFENNIFMECVKDDFINSRSIITGLVNKAMPLVRYDLGDDIVIEQLHQTCDCGSHSPIVSSLKGRTLDSINIGNFTLNSVVLLEIMGEVNNYYNYVISSYKFIYYRESLILQCYIELDNRFESWYHSIKQTIESVFYKRISAEININFKIDLKDTIKPHGNKFRVFEIIN